MEFWPENPGQSPLYSKFGTVPGRNYAHNYHDRQQEPHYPLYYGEQQDQGRESSYWTVPGSRTGGAPQEYTSWTDQELIAPTASRFPFILDRHTQQHQDLGHYQLHRDREWTAAPRPVREYERGFLREGWQRKWEPCGPVHYNREVSAKRSDSSYRELEAWAARYSHSLPRRRRLEAEMRGGSQALLESSRAPERDRKSGLGPRVEALQQVRQSANIREPGLWDRGGRHKAPAYCPSQTPATITSHMMDMKDRMFSQPPGYIAPPPYNSPHKGSSVLHHCDTSWGQEGKRQPYWLRDRDVSVDLQDHRAGEKREFTKPDGHQELEGLKHGRQETDAPEVFSIQEANVQPQVLKAVENKKIKEEPSSKIIEGRKFRLNKKTGGLTIFCLVSRIAGTAETPSLPLCTLQTNTENIELGDISKDPRGSSGIYQTHKLADEVDFKASTLTGQSNTFNARNVPDKQETPGCIDSETLGDKLSSKAETEKENTNDAHPTCARQVAQSLKYPLWREPSATSRADTESSSTWLKVNSDEGETGDLQNPESEVHPTDGEGRRLDMETDNEPEDSKGLLVIDTTCVVVKMELIPSPKKEHVHYLHTEHNATDSQSTKLTSGDVTAEQSTETNVPHSDGLQENKSDSELTGESGTSSLCMSSCPVSEGEMLEERAVRILGIPLNEPIIEQPPAGETSPLALCVQNQQVEPSPIKDDDTNEGERSQNELEDCPTEEAVCLQESDDTKDQEDNEGGGGFAGFDDEVSNVSEENDAQLEADITLSPEIERMEDPVLESASEEGQNEHQCLSPPECEAPDPTLPLTLSSPDLKPLMNISESNTDEGPDHELLVLNSAENPPPLPGSADSTPGSAPHPNHPRSPSFDLTDQTPEAVFDVDEQDDTPQIINSDITEAFEDLGKDMTEELVSEQQSESAAYVIESNATEQQMEDADPTDHIMEQTPKKSKDVTDADVFQQHLECVQEEDVISVKEGDITEEELPKEDKEDTADLLGLNKSLENSTHMEVDVLQHESDNGQEEDVTGEKEGDITEEELPKEDKEDAADLLGLNKSLENSIQMDILQHESDNGQEEDASLRESYVTMETHMEVNVLGHESVNGQEEDGTGEKEGDITEQLLPKEAEDVADLSGLNKFLENSTHMDVLQHASDNGQEEDASLRESYMTTDQSQNESDEDQVEQQLATGNATSSQTQLEILQDVEPSSPPSLPDQVLEAFPSAPRESNEPDFNSLLEKDSDCSSALSPDAAPAADIPETDPVPLHLDSCEESSQFSSSSCADSPPVMNPSSSTAPPQEGGASILDLDLPLKEEPQYPNSLWDVVNRIRKHTAPDSENEEEEVSELWDPESLGEDLSCPDVPGRIISDEVGQQEDSSEGNVEDVEAGNFFLDPRHEESSQQAEEEDTLSCSSTCSHGSEDTVIVADEEETPPDAGTGGKTEDDEECQMGEEEQSCSAAEKHETAAEEEEDKDGGESISSESRQREECPVEAVEVFMVSEEGTIETGQTSQT